MTTCSDEVIVAATNKEPTPPAFGWRGLVQRLRSDSGILPVLATILTTFFIFGIYLFQGVVIARILGAAGRGEFGTALYFPRDILLWAGMLGAVEMITGYAAKKRCNEIQLRYAAARLGLITGAITAVVAAILSICLLVPTGKTYLIPYCLLCCLFVPFEHVHLIISSVDRGTESFWRYNINRIIFALAFPLMMLAAWATNLDKWMGGWLLLTCILWVIAKVVGLLPTLRGMHVFSPRYRREIFAKLTADDKSQVPTSGLLLKEGRPFALSMFMSELFDRLDVFLILAFATVIQSGYYFVAVPAAAMLIIAPNALGVFTFNAGARDDVTVTKSLAVKVLLILAAFQIIATLVFSFFIDELIIFFFTEEFAAAIPFALWLLPASAIKGFQQAPDGYLKGIDKPMIGVKARIYSIIVLLVFAAATYHRFELLSIPMAACVAQTVSMIIILTGLFLNLDSPESKDLKPETSS